MLEEKCMAMPVGGLADIEIEPDDTDVSDTATFVWEIKLFPNFLAKSKTINSRQHNIKYR